VSYDGRAETVSGKKSPFVLDLAEIDLQGMKALQEDLDRQTRIIAGGKSS